MDGKRYRSSKLSGHLPMAKQYFKRKLTAILSADAKDYSRMMGEDEVETVEAITACRAVMTTFIREHRGRVVDSPGDNILAEFASVVDAVASAVAIQKALKEKNDQLPEHSRMMFRMGINLGDVIEEDKRIYGDGVNIAARIEGLAEGGGVCISGTAYDQIGKKLALGYEYIGEQTLKNIEKPVRVYRILMEPEAAGRVIGKAKTKPGVSRRIPLFLGLALVTVGIAVVILNLFSRPTPPSIDTASEERTEIPSTAKPSIAVLPFNNLSGDPEQEYFSDGITNDIITALSKFRELFVIASNSVFVYKGKPVKAQEVNRELGARYILEGSVQQVDRKVRVNAQLVDAVTGHHLWAERYDRDLIDLFAVQDEILHTIVTTLAVKIDAVERARVMHKDTNSLKAYDYVLRGREYLSRATRSETMQARQLFEKAIEIDPRYAAAYVGLGRSQFHLFLYGWTEFPDRALQQSHDLANKALSLEKSDASAHTLLGLVYRYRLQFDLAIKESERALELNPNDARIYASLGTVLNYIGRRDDAILKLETALRLDPRMFPGYHMHLGLAYYLKGRYEDAIGALNRGLGWYPEHVFIHIPLAAAYAQAGRLEEAERTASTILRLHPFFEVDSFGNAFVNSADRASIADGLRKAGLQ